MPIPWHEINLAQATRTLAHKRLDTPALSAINLFVKTVGSYPPVKGRARQVSADDLLAGQMFFHEKEADHAIFTSRPVLGNEH